MGEYVLSPPAISDLEHIYQTGFQQFGPAQSERYLHELFGRFQLLADFPDIGGRPLKVRQVEVFRFPFGSHVIVFTKTHSGVRITRVFHARMDWRVRLRREGL
jgi:toxin ParE1/3/4